MLTVLFVNGDESDVVSVSGVGDDGDDDDDEDDIYAGIDAVTAPVNNNYDPAESEGYCCWC